MPFKRLYDISCDFLNNYEKWMESMIGTYEPDDIDMETGTAFRTIYRLEKVIQEPIPKSLAETVRLKIEAFKEHMPIIYTLGNTSMKSRHWEQVSEIVGFPIKIDETMTLAKVNYLLLFEEINTE